MSGTIEALLDELKTVPDNKERGNLFEQAVRGWLRIDRSVGRYRAVELWKDSRHADGTDIGIDLVAEDDTGELTAVQAKLHTRPVRKVDIDSFLSASGSGRFARRLLVATTPPAPNARRVLRAQQVPVDVVGLDRLLAAPVVWPTLAELRAAAAPRPVAKAAPRPHQVEALADLEPYLGVPGRAQVHMACGTGKSLTALWAAERSGAETVLVLAPALALVKQLISEWAAHTSWEDWAVLPVCSATDVKATGSGTEERPEPADQAGQEELPVGATTDVAQVTTWLDAHPARTKVIVGTYQSSARVAEALAASSLDRFDLAVCDEAHRLGGRPAPDYACVLHDETLPATTRLFFTATPRILAPGIKTRAANSDNGDDLQLLTSMDDTETFGPVAHRLPFRAAVGRGLLCGFQVVVVGVKPGTWTVEELADRRVLVGSKELDAEFVARVEATRTAMADHDLSRVIAYWSRVATAKAASALLRDLGPVADRPVDAAHVTGADPVTKRLQTLRALTHDGTRRAVISNSRCLTEGVDVPVVDTVVFAEPRKSLVDVVQAVGRAMRTADGKTIGTVVVPLLIPDGDEPADFDTVVQVLAALATEDELLAQQLSQLRRASTHRRLTSYDLAGTVVFTRELVDRTDITDALVTSVVERTTSSVWEGVERLAAFKAAHGHASPPQKHVTADEFRLGSWCNARRTESKRGLLDPKVRAALDDLGFVWDVPGERQRKALKALATFKAEYGHCKPTQEYRTADGFRLGAWCVSRRSQRRAGLLDPDLEAALDDLGFEWEPGHAGQERALTALAAFKAEHGHCSPPTDYVTPAGFPLGTWCSHRRRFRRNGRLDPDVEAALNHLGFEWEPGHAAQERALTALAAFKAEHGHCSPTNDYVTPAGFPLGTWCDHRRRFRRNGRLDPDVEAALDDLGFEWEPLRAERLERDRQAIAALQDYGAEHGVFSPEATYVTASGFPLGSWCRGRRRARKEGRLDPQVEAALNALGFVWEPRMGPRPKG